MSSLFCWSSSLEFLPPAYSSVSSFLLLLLLLLLFFLVPSTVSLFSVLPPRKIYTHTLKSDESSTSSSRVCFGRLLRRPRGKDTSPLAWLRSSRKEALYRDRSQTLTVWAFLAAEGGTNKVKRGLKNVTLSVECGPLTVDLPPLSQAPRPHDAVQKAPSFPSFLSRGLFLRHVSSDGADTFA